MRSMFSVDGKQWVYGDAFGVTRMELGKKMRVTKHTLKIYNPDGALSMSLNGKLGLHTGREQTGVYGSDSMVLYGLPALGIKSKTIESSPTGLYTSSVGERVASHEGNTLKIHELQGDKL